LNARRSSFRPPSRKDLVCRDLRDVLDSGFRPPASTPQRGDAFVQRTDGSVERAVVHCDSRGDATRTLVLSLKWRDAGERGHDDESSQQITPRHTPPPNGLILSRLEESHRP
jgi:hypothetical protein